MKLKDKTSVLVVGGGPVGLFAALTLADRGVDVEIIDKGVRGSLHSYALALHPATQQLLDEHGVLGTLTHRGHRVDRIAIHAAGRPVGAFDFAALGGRFPYLLVLPQNELEGALQDRLRQKKIPVRWNHQAQQLLVAPPGVVARIARMEQYSMGYPVARAEWLVTQEVEVAARYVVGADGYDSSVRKAAQIAFEAHGEAQAFAVFEFPCDVERPSEATLFFHEGTTNVLWPITAGRARFGFQVPQDRIPAPTVETLHALIAERAPWFRPKVDELFWTSAAVFERRLAARFGGGPIWLAGDAAHVTGPVGAQSMNVGLREASDLATRLTGVLQSGDARALEGFDADRRAEWRRLLGVDAKVSAAASAAWLNDLGALLLPCVPAGGPTLDALLAQVGARLA